MILERAIRPQMTQISANGLVTEAESGGRPRGKPATDTAPVLICDYLRSLAADLLFLG